MTLSLFASLPPPPLVSQVDAVEWLRSLHSESVDLIVTDPAYESLEKHRAVGTTTRLTNAWFDIFPNSRFPDLFREMYRVLKPNTHCYVMCDQETAFIIKPMGEAAGFTFWKPLVFDKVRIGLGYHFRAQYELVLFFEKGKRRLNDLSIGDVLRCKRVAQWVCDNCTRRVTECGNVEQEGSKRTATSRSRSTASLDSRTTLNGKNTTGRSPKGCRFTTSTATSGTTESRTSSSSTRSNTAGSTPALNYGTESGGSRAPGAESSNQEHASISTSLLGPTTQSPASASAVTRQAAESALKRCAVCGQPRRRVFPTEKPVELLEVLVTQSSVAGELVVDPFMGSASTGVAALRHGRRFAGTDISEASVTLASERLAKEQA